MFAGTALIVCSWNQHACKMVASRQFKVLGAFGYLTCGEIGDRPETPPWCGGGANTREINWHVAAETQVRVLQLQQGVFLLAETASCHLSTKF